eukprot:m.118637 g.118637  ORF g.118637 m.118637 type:complete len:57 (+) comp15454_c0_seq2:114-284(+)
MESISLSFTPSSNGDGEAIQTVQLVLVNAGGLHENLEAIKARGRNYPLVFLLSQNY